MIDLFLHTDNDRVRFIITFYSLVPNRRGGWNCRGATENSQNLITKGVGLFP